MCDIQVHAISNLPHSSNLKLDITLVTLDATSDQEHCGRQAVHTGHATLPAMGSELLWSHELQPLLDKTGCSETTCFGHLEVEVWPSTGGGHLVAGAGAGAGTVAETAGTGAAASLGADTATETAAGAARNTDAGTAGTTAADTSNTAPDTAIEVLAAMPADTAAGASTSTATGTGSSGDARAEGGPLYASSHLWFAQFKDLVPQPPKTTTTVEVHSFKRATPHEVCFVLEAKAPVLLLVLESHLPGRFSDNMLEAVQPCKQYSMCFTTDMGSMPGDSSSMSLGRGEAQGPATAMEIDVDEFKSGLTMMSLGDVHTS